MSLSLPARSDYAGFSASNRLLLHRAATANKKFVELQEAGQVELNELIKSY